MQTSFSSHSPKAHPVAQKRTQRSLFAGNTTPGDSLQFSGRANQARNLGIAALGLLGAALLPTTAQAEGRGAAPPPFLMDSGAARGVAQPPETARKPGQIDLDDCIQSASLRLLHCQTEYSLDAIPGINDKRVLGTENGVPVKGSVRTVFNNLVSRVMTRGEDFSVAAVGETLAQVPDDSVIREALDQLTAYGFLQKRANGRYFPNPATGAHWGYEFADTWDQPREGGFIIPPPNAEGEINLDNCSYPPSKRLSGCINEARLAAYPQLRNTRFELGQRGTSAVSGSLGSILRLYTSVSRANHRPVTAREFAQALANRPNYDGVSAALDTLVSMGLLRNGEGQTYNFTPAWKDGMAWERNFNWYLHSRNPVHAPAPRETGSAPGS